MKDKNHMTIFIVGEKAFDKIQHPFMIKMFSKVGIEGAPLNLVKAIHNRPTANITLSRQKLKHFLKIRNKTTVFILTILIQHSTGSSNHSNHTRKRKKKGIQIGKEEVKQSLFADNLIVYIKNPIGSTKKLLNLISEFCKVAGYKVRN